ncbi:MAG: nucleotidyltransferase domain-containing protein [Bacteroidota bacterium]|nr:nucleotidyltransferase domain-containing protein [Bacteroidota bacterium]
MTIKELKDKDCLLFECISGSQAYGTATAKSDTDIKGIYLLPQEQFYSLTFEEQINENDNNVMFYELRKFIDLLSKNNPNMLELIAIPGDCILFKHPLYDLIRPELFLSKLCKDSFAGYAMTQIKKARGLNKKILNPMDRQRKSILDFCYVVAGQGAVSTKAFLQSKNMKQENCGLVAIPHMREVFGLYYSSDKIYEGLMRKEDSMDITLSSVKEGEFPVATMTFNKDGFSKYCKDYKEYWDWVGKRNEVRFENTIEHGKNYDAKNMMHTFRLLDMAEEIGRTGTIVVRRSNREFLLEIKSGKFSYEELVERAEEQLKKIEFVYQQSALPEQPDLEKINELLVRIRSGFYSGYSK